ncbi:transmembrane protein, putative (macronuclear) [Tetrahymena thermophila SB210]|uniref:Transmembrane protein, putative n=1 Tax=Tetrahymena thermophila (strain SB210) TaxID=312017 RepID=W7XGU4_TETTS|nr:transmembrane protein, putative [Tetrahymena thermophila SB210]EWS73451.1 transmembrane protein, putative [Tetrahymena thermophila SB210]|eukprot:XP_012654022.1 transmembrane protein, putative [Tetrahymena thermophila SB210]
MFQSQIKALNIFTKNKIFRQFSQLEIDNLLAQQIKYTIYAFIYALYADHFIQISEESQICHVDGKFFIKFVQIGSLLTTFLYTGFLKNRKNLRDKDFIFLYLFNILFFTVVLIYVLYSSAFYKKECSTLPLFKVSLLFMCIKKEFELAILVFTRSLMWLRQVNICSNILTVVIIQVSFTNAQNCSPQATSLCEFLNIINTSCLFTYTFINLLVSDKNQYIQTTILKIATGLLIPVFIYAYIMIVRFQFIGQVNLIPDCIPYHFILNVNLFIIPLDILGMFVLQYILCKQQDQQPHLPIPENDSLINNNQIEREGLDQFDKMHYNDDDDLQV